MKDNYLQKLYSECSLLEYVVCTLVTYQVYCKYSKIFAQIKYIHSRIKKIIL